MKILLAIMILISATFADYTYTKFDDNFGVYSYDDGIVMYETSMTCGVIKQEFRVAKTAKLIKIDGYDCNKWITSITFDIKTQEVTSILSIVDGNLVRIFGK